MGIASRSEAPLGLANFPIRAVCTCQHNSAHRQCGQQESLSQSRPAIRRLRNHQLGVTCPATIASESVTRSDVAAARAMRKGVPRGSINTVDFILSPSRSDVEFPHCAGAYGLSTNATSQ